MKNILEYKKAISLVGTAFLTVAGACGGYIYAHRELEKDFENRVTSAISAEVERTRKYYTTMYKDFQPEDVSEMDDVPKDLVTSEHQIIIPQELLHTEEGRAQVMAAVESSIQPELEMTPVRVGDEGYEAPDFDLDSLIRNRSADHPYVISTDEYVRNDAKYEQHALTWFEGDGVLIDFQDDVIPDTDGVVGDGNLSLFGVMSGNNNVVYVQNDQILSSFEITRSMQKASTALYGPTADEEDIIEHSSMKRRRPRDDH